MVLKAFPCIFFILVGLVVSQVTEPKVSFDDIDLHPLLFGFGTPEPVGAQRYFFDSKTVYIDVKRAQGGFPLDHLWEADVHTMFASISAHPCEYTIGWVEAGDVNDESTYLQHVVRLGSITGASHGTTQQVSSSSVLFLRGNEFPDADVAREDVDFIFVHVDSCYLSRYIHRSQFNRWNQAAFLMDWGVSPIGGSWQHQSPATLARTERWEDSPETTDNRDTDGGHQHSPIGRDSTLWKDGAGWFKHDFFFNFGAFMGTDVQPVLDVWWYANSFSDVFKLHHAFCEDTDFVCDDVNADYVRSDSRTWTLFRYEDNLDMFGRLYFDYEIALEEVNWSANVVLNNTIHRFASSNPTGNGNRFTGVEDFAFPPYARIWDKAYTMGSPSLINLGRTLAGQVGGYCTLDVTTDTLPSFFNAGGTGSNDQTTRAMLYYSTTGLYNVIACGDERAVNAALRKRAINDLVFSFTDGAELLHHPYIQLSEFAPLMSLSSGFRVSISGNPLPLYEVSHPAQEDNIFALPMEVQIGLGVTHLNQHQQVTIRRTESTMALQGWVVLRAGVRDMCPEDNNPCGHGACYVAYSGFECVCADHWMKDANGSCTVDEVECNDMSCFNGGNCTDNDGVAGYTCACPEGWTGSRCERVTSNCHVDVSGKSVCLNGGACMDMGVNKIQCDCSATAFTGAWCETPKDICALEPTYCGAGACEANATAPYGIQCNCAGTGMVGKQCDVNPLCDPEPCMHGGICEVDGGAAHCICPSHYYGDHCEDMYEEYLKDCRYFDVVCGTHGTCETNALGKHRCSCNPHWSGDSCEMHDVCVHNPCMHGGHCAVDSTTPDHAKTPICTCTGNWFGNLCEESLADYFDDCRFSPHVCQHEGVCSLVDLKDGSAPHHACINCHPGWSGDFCEIADVCATNNGGCLNGATCSLGSDGHAKCTCAGVWTGPHCEWTLDAFVQMRFESFTMDCRFSEMSCMHEGSCSMRGDGSYACHCADLWTGDRCETAKSCEPNPCLNGGTCQFYNGGSSCMCTGGHVGSHCEWTLDAFFSYDCRLRDCQHGGTCTTDGKCVCDTTHWVGEFCELPVVCQGHSCHGGECVVIDGHASCLCPGHLFGDSCQYDVEFGLSDCRTNKCLHGGTCAEFGNSGTYVCNCLTSQDGGTWTGDHCETSRHCAPNPCMNGGECHEHAGAAACLCAGDWTGKTCTVSLDTRLAAVEVTVHDQVASEVVLQLTGTADADDVAGSLMATTGTVTKLQGTVDAIAQQLSEQTAHAAEATTTVQSIYDNYARKEETQSIHDLLDELLSPASTVVASFAAIFIFVFAHLL